MVRAWLIFFGEGPPGWWRFTTRPGFRHVAAAGCDADRRLWIFYDPSLSATTIDAIPYGPEAEAHLAGYLVNARHMLRMEARDDRRLAPPMFACVAAIKALLGVRCRSVTPRGLYRDLIGLGAEIVEVPSGRIVRRGEGAASAASPARGPGGCEAAPRPAGASGGGPTPIHSGKVAARHPDEESLVGRSVAPWFK